MPTFIFSAARTTKEYTLNVKLKKSQTPTRQTTVDAATCGSAALSRGTAKIDKALLN